MLPLDITHSTVVSAIGRGTTATMESLRARRSGLIPCDFAEVTHGYVGQVPGLDDHAMPPDLAAFDCRNHRLADLSLRTDGFMEAVAEARARLGAARIAVVVGTSTSGILSCEDAFRDRVTADGALPQSFDYTHTHDLFALARYVRAVLGLSGPALTVSVACASSARAFLDAAHLITAGICDAAVVGGADSLCRMTLRGFTALDLVAPGPSRPCDATRDGISVGEAAGFMLLERASDRSKVALLGIGATSDGYHISAPRPDGAGAVVAMRQALAAAGLTPEAIDYVNLHGTGTRANDAAEDQAMTTVFGSGTPCSSTKGWSGHTMGSCGILEAVISTNCLREGFIPGCLGVTEIDPTFRAGIVTENQDRPLRHVMSNSFGFGGANCSLVFGPRA
ncbi:beta-ketoacyl-[acyl-carrier-protein] synthase family protein [Acidisoma cladoniae]|jgi:3-oxoacyl-[acyl-carrier-protein] synthase-1|uniref:beta-ketoacyl-[acyl-carrier-protein] synthase family protein n=1 Tax=Acidisoma cladoniae TaxID=3040935 RepID=UPI002550E779|nr:beta-ketoacyl-[acyl-carrier-protein] synthase family protein [Acidisoma sp. PAMC 29798]